MSTRDLNKYYLTYRIGASRKSAPHGSVSVVVSRVFGSTLVATKALLFSVRKTSTECSGGHVLFAIVFNISPVVRFGWPESFFCSRNYLTETLFFLFIYFF